MNFYRTFLGFYLIFFVNTFAFAAVSDIENRLIYSDYSKKVSMDFRDVSLSDVLKVFSKQSGMNFISALDVSKIKITLFLDNVPVEEALEKILDANDLTYELNQDSDLFVVKQKTKDKTITKVFPLKFATVSSSKMNDKNSAGGIKATIDSLKSAAGSVQEDSRTNSFIITDLPERFPLYEETIAKLDVPVLQILIEVEILDVSKGTSDKIGVLYGSRPIVLKGSSKETLLPFDQNYILRKMNNGAPYKIDSGSSGSSTSSGSSGSSGGSSGPANSLKFTPGSLDFSGMTAALDFLKSQSDTRSLARPRILTLDNQTAHIEVGGTETVAIETKKTTSTVGQDTSEDIKTAETGVTLDVTPQANFSTGEILMKISPSIKEVKQTIFTTSNGAPVFDVEVRKADTIMKAKNGETIIIGGLMRTQTSNTVDKLPFLGDLPFIGAPFRHKNSSKSERELIIFITPHILDDQLKKKLDLEGLQRFDREGTQPLRIDAINQQLDSSEQSARK